MEKQSITAAVESSQKSQDSSKSQDSDLRSLFKAFDKDNSGYIDKPELKSTMEELGVSMTDSDIVAMLKEAGVTHSRIYYEGNVMGSLD